MSNFSERIAVDVRKLMLEDMLRYQNRALGKLFLVAPAAVNLSDLSGKFDNVFTTIDGAVDACSSGRGDQIWVSPGSYNETVTVDKDDLTIMGLGGRGAAFIEPTTAGAEGMQVKAPDVTLVNMGIACDDTGDYALNLNGNIGVNADGVRRFRAYGCKIEGASGASSIAVLLNGDADDNVGDVLFRDCEFAWADKGIIADASGYGVPTQIFLEKCKFHNLTTSHIAENDADAWFTNLIVTDCVFERMENGDAPTDFLVVDHADSTGQFSGNRFAYATNEADVLTIGAKILWLANATEAGWSTARPS